MYVNEHIVSKNVHFFAQQQIQEVHKVLIIKLSIFLAYPLANGKSLMSYSKEKKEYNSKVREKKNLSEKQSKRTKTEKIIIKLKSILIEMKTNRMNVFRIINPRLFSLAFVFFFLIFSVEAKDNKDKGKDKEQNQENVVIYSVSEAVFVEQVSGEFEAKVSKAITNALQHGTKLIRVFDKEGNMLVETTDAREIPANAEKLMEYRKIAFYIVNL